jgi:NTE family protein
MVKGRKTLGLALGAGGWKGLAHIGVIKVLVKNNIPIDYIAGSSAGALIGGLYAALRDIYQVERIARKLTYRDLASALADPRIFSGMFKGERMVKFLTGLVGEINIEDLPIPFSAVTTNLLTGQTSPIMKGDLARAIRASGSVPFLFQPVTHKGQHYADGVISMPVPVKIVRNMGADVVLAVNLYGSMFSSGKPIGIRRPGSVGTAQIAHNLLIYNLALTNSRLADLVVNPRIPVWGGDPLTKFVGNSKIVKKGEIEMEKNLSYLEKLLGLV